MDLPAGELGSVWVEKQTNWRWQVGSTVTDTSNLNELELLRHEDRTMRVVNRILERCGDAGVKVECSRQAPKGQDRCGPGRLPERLR